MRRDCLAVALLPGLALVAGFEMPGLGSNIGMAGFGDGRTFDIAGTASLKSDIKYIKCDICNLVAKQAYRQTKAAEKDLKPGKKLSEIDIIEIVEKLTNANKDEGEWLASIDLVESGDRLLVKEMDKMGKCGTECKTVQKAAEQVVDGIDTDMAERLWQGKLSRSQFTNWLCQEATSSCRGKPPPLPADRPKGEAFVESDPEEAKMQRMMSTMKEMGMGGQIFNRDQAKRMADGGEPEEYDEYGDDSNPKPEAGEPGGDDGADAAEPVADAAEAEAEAGEARAEEVAKSTEEGLLDAGEPLGSTSGETAGPAAQSEAAKDSEAEL